MVRSTLCVLRGNLCATRYFKKDVAPTELSVAWHSDMCVQGISLIANQTSMCNSNCHTSVSCTRVYAKDMQMWKVQLEHCVHNI